MKKTEITDQELLRRIELAEQQQASEIAKGGFYHDPIEDDPKIGPIVQAAYDRADSEIAPQIIFGRCHNLWWEVGRILAEEHGIKWYPPSYMNPGARFD